MDFRQYAEANFEVVERGTEWWGAKCKWHDDSTPSLRINVVSGWYRCMSASCGRRGNLSGIRGKGEVLEINAPQYVAKALARHAEAIRTLPEGRVRAWAMNTEYWTKQRKLSRYTCKRFMLGMNLERNTATMPLREIDGRLVGVIERRLGTDHTMGKYRDPAGVPKTKFLYGSWELDRETPTVALTEGPVDALALWDVGIPSVAIMGSSLSDYQLLLLKRLNVTKVVLFPDLDSAGDRVFLGSRNHPGACEMLNSAGIFWSVATYRSGWGKDPAALSANQRNVAFDSALSQITLAVAP